MDLQPLYDVKERLGYAAIAGASLLGDDFRLQRAAEALKPLAAASPVFGKIDAGLTKLLAAPADQRSGLLLDVLALVDAVAYTQAKTGIEGELEPLPTGGGWYYQISYGQIAPLLHALSSTGGGRVEIVKSAWERCPDWFQDYRILPAVIGGLGDSYGEMAGLCAKLLKKMGPDVVPMLKKGFDPAGKKDMVRRVELAAALEGERAGPWLREVLPLAKKDVRAAVIRALGVDSGDTALLLDLAKSERGAARDAALQALALQEGAEVRAFWEAELEKDGDLVKFLQDTKAEWAAQLVASGLRERLEGLLSQERPAKKDCDAAARWCAAIGRKDCPVMLDFWRWADGHMEALDQLKDEKGQPPFLGVRLTDHLRDVMLHTAPGPLRDYCLGLFDRRPEMTRYLRISFQAALLSLPAAEVYEKYSPYVVTIKPLLGAERRETLNNVLLRALQDVTWSQGCGCHFLAGDQPMAQPLDPRWVKRLVHAVWKQTVTGQFYPFGGGDAVNGFDKALMDLADLSDPDQRAQLVPYLRQRMAETGSWYSYGRYLLQAGGSPRGVLGESMKKGKPAYLYYVWALLAEAAKALSASEMAGLCQEVLDARWVRPVGHELAMSETVLPWTVEQLRAGRPFPEWNDWWNMRS